MLKHFILLFFIPLLFLGCNEDDSSGSGISRACSNDLFAPKPDSVCPVDDLLSTGARGSVCLCESEFGEKFILSTGPSVEGDPNTINIGNITFGIALKDCSTLSLFENAPPNDPVGELQDLASGNEIGSLEFLIFLNADSSSERVICPACYTGSQPRGCNIYEELE